MVDYFVLTLDVADLDVQSEFWCAAAGYDVAGGVGQYRSLTRADGAIPKLLLQQVSEPKTAKNRLHLDLHVADIEGEAVRLESLGATRIGPVDGFGISWIVMHDPEGNEFCVCPA